MKKDVEKFKKIMSEIDRRTNDLHKFMQISSPAFVEKEAGEIRELKIELIQMYSELEEPQEKPVKL